MEAILDFRLERFKLFLIYKSPQCFLPSFRSNGISIQEEKHKIDFQDVGHLGFLTGMILAIFYLQVTPMPPTKFQVNWPFSSGEKVKNRFSRWPRPSWISDRNNISYFLSTSHHDTSYQVLSQLAFWFRRRSKKTCKMATMAAILDCRSK